MAMSRKDYVLLAEALRSTLPEPAPDGLDSIGTIRRHKYVQHRETTSAIIRALSRDNPRFDQSKFIDAVYGEKGVPG